MNEDERDTRMGPPATVIGCATEDVWSLLWRKRFAVHTLVMGGHGEWETTGYEHIRIYFPEAPCLVTLAP